MLSSTKDMSSIIRELKPKFKDYFQKDHKPVIGLCYIGSDVHSELGDGICVINPITNRILGRILEVDASIKGTVEPQNEYDVRHTTKLSFKRVKHFSNGNYLAVHNFKLFEIVRLPWDEVLPTKNVVNFLLSKSSYPERFNDHLEKLNKAKFDIKENEGLLILLSQLAPYIKITVNVNHEMINIDLKIEEDIPCKTPYYLQDMLNLAFTDFGCEDITTYDNYRCSLTYDNSEDLQIKE